MSCAYGELRFARRPLEPIDQRRYWQIVEDQFQDMIDDEEGRDHWIRMIISADPVASSTHGLFDQLRNSDFFRDSFGCVPERIYPEEFQYDPGAAESNEPGTLEEFVYSVWSHAGS